MLRLVICHTQRSRVGTVIAFGSSMSQQSEALKERSMLFAVNILQEADESVCWLEIIVRSGITASTELPSLCGEGNELRAIFSRSLGTARANSRVVSEMTR